MTRCLPFVAVAVALLSGCGGGGSSTPPAAPVQQRPAPKPVAVAPPVPVQANPGAPNVGAPNAGVVEQEQRPLGDAEGEVASFTVGTDADAFELLPATEAAAENEYLLDDAPEDGPWSVGLGEPPAPPGTPGTVQLPPKFEALPEFGYDDRGFARRISCETDRSIMVLVPAGHFTLGTDDGPEDARPAVSMFLEAYYIDLAEVNLVQYRHFREQNTSATGRRIERAANDDGGGDFDPAIGIRYSDASAYAEWCGKDLPTEAEWEKAARGPDGAPFPWGRGRAMFSFSRTTDDVDRIMTFPQDTSYYGVKDMAGNAREWCKDWYSADGRQRALDDGETFENWTGPRNPNADYQRVAKGNGPDWAAWHREARTAGEVDGVGFRCVLRYRPPRKEDAAASR